MTLESTLWQVQDGFVIYRFAVRLVQVAMNVNGTVWSVLSHKVFKYCRRRWKQQNARHGSFLLIKGNNCVNKISDCCYFLSKTDRTISFIHHLSIDHQTLDRDGRWCAQIGSSATPLHHLGPVLREAVNEQPCPVFYVVQPHLSRPSS